MHSVSNPNFSRVRVIERQTLQSEAMGLYSGAAGKPSCWSEGLRKSIKHKPNIKEVIETFRFYASLFRAFLSIDGVSSGFRLTARNPG